MLPEQLSSGPVVRRLVIVAACFVAGTLYLTKASTAEEVPPRESLASLPMLIDGWQGRREPDFTPDILRTLGVDDYTTRTYFRQSSLPVGLYVGYHNSQRQGDAIHSPLNCLPGAGWQPLEQGRTVIPFKVLTGQHSRLKSTA